MNAFRIEPLKYPWPTMFYAGAVGLAWPAQAAAPLSWPRDGLLMAAGAGAVALGMWLVLWGVATLWRSRTAFVSGRPTRLVICGPFRYSRNPIYLGYTLVTLGAAFLLDMPWLTLSAVAAAAVTQVYVIRKEEMHLLARFGYEFERYCRRTRIWI